VAAYTLVKILSLFLVLSLFLSLSPFHDLSLSHYRHYLLLYRALHRRTQCASFSALPCHRRYRRPDHPDHCEDFVIE
jgi:hypothetical protein